MTFLAPIPALVAAAVCVPALVVLYLLKLRRRPIRVGSILFWPKATEDVQANVPLRWLKPSWLFFLHLLALALLLLAFARPAMPGIGIAGERVVIVLDTSASMSAVDAGENRPRLDLAKDRARRLARDVRSAGARSVAVVQLAARARPLTGFTTSPALASAAIDSAEPTDQPGNLGAALQLVDALAQSDGEDAAATPPTVFLVSDGSFAQFDEVPVTAARLRFERVGPANGLVDNVGIVRLAARRDDRDATLLRVFGELLNAAGAPVDVPVTLAIDGVAMESRVVPVPPSPARTPVLFEVRGVTEGVLTLAIARPDALASDDVASVVLVKPEQPRVLLVQSRPQPARADSTNAAPTWLLGDILEELRPRELVRANPAEYERLVLEGNDRSFDLLVFDAAKPATPPRVPSISLGTVPPLGGLAPAAAPAATRPNSVFWDRSHPLMRGVPLDNLVVREVLPVTTAAQTAPPPQIVARSDDRPLIVLTEEAGVRHVVVCFDLAQSNWPLTPSFAVFVANAMDELTLRARSAEGKSFSTSEPVSFTAPARGAVVLEGPVRVVARESGEIPAGEAPSSETTLSVGVLPRAGVYVVRAEGSGRTPKAVAINVADPVETAAASPESVRVEGREIGSVQPTRVPQEVWQWFVVAALVLLAAEWVVYARQVRA
ncbi:MAG TPA: VWA domain-containing protein [Phycisphaerales bacterium]|nr:VWA domain-containing protein [Phycisphaerales bacterium]